MSVWTSPVKQKLREGRPVFAATVTVGSADVAAHLAAAGFDFLWVEMEHSPVTLESLRNMVLATQGLPAQLFARVPVNEFWTAKRVLDAGASGVIFPFTSTPDLARQAAAACKYPPAGRRGSGAVLASFGWPGGDPYHDSADENETVIAIIEEASAVECVDEIAATPGIDALFLGVSDLSFSMGLRGEQGDPRLEAAIATVLEAGKRHGKAVGRPAWSAEQARAYIEQGFRLFQAQTDLGLMVTAAKEYLSAAAER
jgi:2-keto-3-deoxy-L-rhamnonate aldolase RhmA